MAAKTGRGSDQFVLRLPDGMRDRIKAAAERNNRSMNAEIVATLEVHFPEPTQLTELQRSLDAAIDQLYSASEEEIFLKKYEVIRHLQDLSEEVFRKIIDEINEAKEETLTKGNRD